MASETTKSLQTSKVVVATTVALSFISFWRGASIVLADLASSAFYAGGIATVAVGPAAPWFVLAVMLFSFAVRSVYMESCSMFVRAVVYIVVKDSMMQQGRNRDSNYFGGFFGVGVALDFWWNHIKGIHESSGKALRIMQITTVMVAIFLIWCPLTILLRGNTTLPPAPVPSNLEFGDSALGWLKGTFWPGIPAIAMIIAFGHALLSMSGFETLAQVYREIAYPKMKNLRITANIVCWYALIGTGVITMLSAMILKPAQMKAYSDNLLGGLTMHLAGPALLKLIFHVFVVIVGTLILSGAVNTAMIGANGVLNRVAEDGVLLDWFRKPHKRFGTTHHIINVVTGLQIATIALSRGDVYLLGEAYAFGVVWSFFLKSLGVLALRYQRHDQEYKFPLNIRILGVEIPIGLGLTTLFLR